MIRLINFFGCCLFILFIVLSLRFSFISSDAPYYLSVSKDLADGLVPYKDLYLSYTPLMMYLNAPLFIAVDDFRYVNFLAYQYIYVFATLGIFFKVTRNFFELNRSSSFFLSLILGIAILSSDGNYINLEIYSILSVFIALYFFSQGKIYWSGVLVGISFLFKQYGIINIVPFLFLILNSNHKVTSKIFTFILGSIFPILIFIGYFTLYRNVGAIELFEQLSGVKYIEYSSRDLMSLYTWVIGAKVFLIIFLPIMIVLRTKCFLKHNIPWISGIFLFSLITMIQSFQHYFINVLPFVFMLIASNWRNQFLHLLSIGGVVLLIIFSLRLFKYRFIYQEQIKTSTLFMDLLDDGDSVFIDGGIRYLYLLNNYNNPLKQKIGYSYFHYLQGQDLEGFKVISTRPKLLRDCREVDVGRQTFYLKL